MRTEKPRQERRTAIEEISWLESSPNLRDILQPIRRRQGFQRSSLHLSSSVDPSPEKPRIRLTLAEKQRCTPFICWFRLRSLFVSATIDHPSSESKVFSGPPL